MAYICMAQVGMVLTKAARDNQTFQCCTDGSPVAGFHVEGAIVKIDSQSLSLIPRVSGSKRAEEAAEVFVTSLDECQQVYNDVYEALLEKSKQESETETDRMSQHKNSPIIAKSLPQPLPQGSLLLRFTSSVSDHAPNEGAKVGCITTAKLDRAAEHRIRWRELGFDSINEYDRYAGTKLWTFYCSNHKNMLLAKALRNADHKLLIAALGDERDSDEFRTSNLLDMLQLQLSKMFGHTKDSYAFGHGVIKFQAWMTKYYKSCWSGIERLVGNRAQIFLSNAVVMYHMSSYYQVCP